MPEITWDELRTLPTLAQSQDADLKIDTSLQGGVMRVWLSRCRLSDGEVQPIQVEHLVDGCWVDVTGSEDPKASSFKTHYFDGMWAGFFVTCITRRFR